MDEEEKPENPPEVKEQVDWEKLFKSDPQMAIGKFFQEAMEADKRRQTSIPQFGGQYDMSFENGDSLHIHFQAASVERIRDFILHVREVFRRDSRFLPLPERPPHQPQPGSKP